jgi:hypothetical protein
VLVVAALQPPKAGLLPAAHVTSQK